MTRQPTVSCGCSPWHAAVMCGRSLPGSPDHRPLLLADERRVVELAEPTLDLVERYADGLLDQAEIMRVYSNVHELLSMRRPELEPWGFALVALLRAASTRTKPLSMTSRSSPGSYQRNAMGLVGLRGPSGLRSELGGVWWPCWALLCLLLCLVRWSRSGACQGGVGGLMGWQRG